MTIKTIPLSGKIIPSTLHIMTPGQLLSSQADRNCIYHGASYATLTKITIKFPLQDPIISFYNSLLSNVLSSRNAERLWVE